MLIGITLAVVYLSQMGSGDGRNTSETKQNMEARRQAEEARIGRSQMKELRRARADIRTMGKRRHAAGLRPVAQNVTDPASVEKKNAGHAAADPQTANMRNDIRYKFTVYAHKPSAAIHQLENAIRRAEIEVPEIAEGKNIELLIPQKAYLEFVDDMQALGKLQVERVRYRSDTPPSSPVPFEILIKKDTGTK